VLIIILLSLSTLAVLLLLCKTIWSLSRFSYRANSDSVLADKLPSVSICIAARNETHALARCLENILRSDYPKLVVLDDSSTDNTSLIIKSFALAGVRFIAGNSLPAGWLGKNFAYQTLIDESSGEYVLFLDVDTSISTSTVRQLIEQVVANDRAMISVLPRRDDSYHVSALFGTMRYYWELILSSRSHPPASSAIWLVRRQALAQAGIGLVNYGMSVRPERHLAHQLQRSKQYYYIIGNRKLGIAYAKRLSSQYETALRLYYPMSGRQFVSWIMAVLFVGLLIFPLVNLAVATNDTAIWLLSALLVIITALTFGLFVRQTYGSVGWIFRVAIGPVLLMQELVLLTLSYILYGMGKVTWKGRSVAAQPARHDALRLDE